MNAIDGQHPLEPILPPAVTEDGNEDMSKRKKASVTIQVFYHAAEGTDYHEVASSEFPTPIYPVDKMVSHLAARATEAMEKRIPKGGTNLKD